MQVPNPIIATVILVSSLGLSVPAMARSDSAVQGRSDPNTYGELFRTTNECGMYFSLMVEGLEKTGGSQVLIESYGERASMIPWFLASLGELLSDDEWHMLEGDEKTLSKVMKLKAGRKFENLDALKEEYDEYCFYAFENFDNFSNAINTRLKKESGALYVEWEYKCVTISTIDLSATGVYWGMVGPSVKKVPKGGLRIPDPASGDKFKLGLARGTVADWATIPIPDPPKRHAQLLALMEEEQARVLGKVVHRRQKTYGGACNRPEKPYFRGLDSGGFAYWAVTCEGGDSWSLVIDQSNKIRLRYGCQWNGDRDYPECYSPCSRDSCYTTKVGVSTTTEYLPVTTSTHVRRERDELCEEITGSTSVQYRGDPPDKDKVHKVEIMAVHPPACADIEGGAAKLSIQIKGAQYLDVMDIDIASITVPGYELDYETGPPCRLIHGDPLVDDYADLNCQLKPAARAPEELTVERLLSGRFFNDARFEAVVSVCAGPGG